MPVPHWLHAPTTGRVDLDGPRRIRRPADPFAERWEDEPDEHVRVFLANRALRRDPGFIQAHLLLAGCEARGDVVTAHVNKAVETGRQLWSPTAARDPDLTWWWDTGTRPYMRALAAKADIWAEMGDRWTASAIRGQRAPTTR